MVVDLSDALSDATIDLALAGIENPKNDAELLLAHNLGVDRGELHRRLVLGSLEMGDAAAANYAALIARRARHEPLQHVTGQAHFRRLTLQVGPGVFIPRPETEVVAGAAIAEVERLRGESEQPGSGMAWQAQAPIGPPTARPKRLMRWALQPQPKRPLVIDLGTGSGAIALAVATETNAQVIAIELADAAYQWAAKNITELPPNKAVELRRADALSPPADLIGKADVVVANPPYIPPDAVPRDAEVRDYDPPTALYGGGPDGLELPSGFIAAAGELLRPGGLLIMEHGDNQGADIRGLARAAGVFTNIETHQDLTGRDRYLSARKRPAA